MTTPLRLIDTHCHLDVAAFDNDRTEVHMVARQRGVCAQVIPGIHATGWTQLLTLCKTAPDLYPALGLHPLYLAQHRFQDLITLERLLTTSRPLAVGEIGLDYWVKESDRSGQQWLFETQLDLAAVTRLPLLLHVRKAHDAVLKTLRRYTLTGGIVHAFNGSLQQAHQYLALGFKLGFGGLLTFERSRKLRDLARQLPAAALVLETDAPDLTGVSHVGKRNSPAYLPEYLTVMAQIRGEDPAVTADYTTQNAYQALAIAAFQRQVVPPSMSMPIH